MADYEDTKVTDLVINNMSQEKFDELKAAGELDPTQIYLTPTEESGGGGASLPDQTGNAGKFLKTDGTTASWGNALENIAPEEGGSIVVGSGARVGNAYNAVIIGTNAGRLVSGNGAVAIGDNAGHNALATSAIAIGVNAQAGYLTNGAIAIGAYARASASNAIQLGMESSFAGYSNSDANTFKVGNANGNFEIMSADGTIPRERMSTLVEVLPTAENGYTTVKNYGNGYVEITGYTAIGTVGASTGSEVQIDLPTGYTMANANYWVNIAPTSETTMFDFKAEAKARSTTHFMVAYKNEDTATGLTAAGVYWEVRGMLATE